MKHCYVQEVRIPSEALSDAITIFVILVSFEPEQFVVMERRMSERKRYHLFLVKCSGISISGREEQQ